MLLLLSSFSSSSSCSCSSSSASDCVDFVESSNWNGSQLVDYLCETQSFQRVIIFTHNESAHAPNQPESAYLMYDSHEILTPTLASAKTWWARAFVFISFHFCCFFDGTLLFFFFLYSLHSIRFYFIVFPLAFTLCSHSHSRHMMMIPQKAQSKKKKQQI